MSVIVCAYNSENLIHRAIESLLAQDYPSDRFEILVVDDGSTDRTSQVIRKYPVALIQHNTNQGLAAARNSGLAHMKGDIYVSFDDDCIVDSSWLRQLAVGYECHNVAGVGSMIAEPSATRGIAGRFMAAAGTGNPSSLRLGASKNPIRRFTAYFIDQIRHEAPASEVWHVRELNGATATFRADILRAVGGWDSSLRAAEDIDLCSRIAAEFPDLRFIAVSAARIVHDPDMSLRKFLQRPYARGTDTLKYYRRNGMVPPIFPFPLLYAAIIAATALVNPLVSLGEVFVLPQLFYVWWPIRVLREWNFWHVLHAYIQLLEEAATIAGLVHGQILSMRQSAKAHRAYE